MYYFGRKSRDKRESCCTEIQLLCDKAIQIFDFSIIHGRRLKELQNELYHQGFSTKRWPDSKHNNIDPEALSDAFDFAPYPINWRQEKNFVFLAGIFKSIANEEDILIRWGGDWDSDNNQYDQTFIDLGHIEIIRPS